MSIAVKRFLSYIFDMILVYLVLMLVKPLFPLNIYNIKLLNLNEQYYEQSISSLEYFNEYATVMHKADMHDIGLNIFMTILLVVVFVVIPSIFNGQTIGQKLLKLKITKKNEIKMDDFIQRGVIINGIGYMFFMFIILFLTSDKIYFTLINLLGFLQIIVVIINGFMVLYSKQHCGIADKITKTRIEEIK